MTRVTRRVAGLGAAVILAAACGVSAPSPAASPSRPASHALGPPGLDWSTATAVERPEGMEATPPSISPVGSGGGLGHPGHFAGQGNLYDVVAVGGRLVAVGYTFPGFHGVTWTSTDRQAWRLAELPGAAETAFPLAIATGTAGGPTAGRSVIGGRIGNDAAAWSSADGSTWAAVDGGPAFREAPETRITTIVSTPGGFVSGGWVGLITEPGRARFWTSPEGTAWTGAGDDPAFGDGRVAAIAAGPGGLVAVGTTGAVGRATGSAVWRSTDGSRWERVADPDLASGEMVAVAAGGPGFVAVGADLDSKAAAVWLSADGIAWERVSAQESLTYHGLGITMADVVAGPDGALVAVGHFLFGEQYGQGTAWTSSDGGRTWTRMPDQASFGQGEPLSVIADGSGYVAVGTVGAPDNFIPTVWLSPSR